MRINTKSIIFRTAILYIVITLLNISIFVLLIFENQMDLIAENAILNSQHKGSNLKYRIDKIIDYNGELDQDNVNKILLEASRLGIDTISLFTEAGRAHAVIKNGKPVNSPEAAKDETFKLINIAIAKRDFEDKLFFHLVKKEENRIDLYIPFNFSIDKIGIAAITLEMKDVDRQMTYLYRQCLVIAILIITIHALFAFALSKMLIMPLRTLYNAARSISKGKLNIRVPIVREDEIGQLANSFNEMSAALQGMQDEAKEANPLTGLPGNTKTSLIIEGSFITGRTFCLLYCDLDNFKAYNDKYGFKKGDEIILYTRDRLLETAGREEFDNIFVGHQGGDDFVVICDYEYGKVFAEAFIKSFDRGVRRFYNKIDAQNGYIESVNRSGKKQRFPLMSVSVAIATNKYRSFSHQAEMIQVVAELKSYVKKKDGSAYVIDSRGENSD
jgi:diguanylate cyclase (GGDEF)-like protein